MKTIYRQNKDVLALGRDSGDLHLWFQAHRETTVDKRCCRKQRAGWSQSTTVLLSDIKAGWWQVAGRPSITFLTWFPFHMPTKTDVLLWRCVFSTLLSTLHPYFITRCGCSMNVITWCCRVSRQFDDSFMLTSRWTEEVMEVHQRVEGYVLWGLSWWLPDDVLLPSGSRRVSPRLEKVWRGPPCLSFYCETGSVSSIFLLIIRLLPRSLCRTEDVWWTIGRL